MRHAVELSPHHARPGGGRRLPHAQCRGDGPRLDVQGGRVSGHGLVNKQG